MHWTPKFQYASRSDTGMKRQNNEDTCSIMLCPEQEMWLSRGHLFAVADGMGGHEVGELASKTAIDTLPHVFFKSPHNTAVAALRNALSEANAAIHKIGVKNRDFNRMGTTCSSLIINAEGFIVGHVGDSRVYRIREDRIDQLTFDHTVAWEQRLKQKANNSLESVDADKYGHVLTRCLGPEAEVSIDTEGPFEYLPGDVFVLCTDGVTKYLNDIEIGTISKNLPPSEAVRLIVNLANLRGGADNSTAVIVRISKQDGSTTPPPSADYSYQEPPPRWAQPLLLFISLLCGIGAGVLSYFQWAVLAACVGFFGAAFLVIAFYVSRERQRILSGEADANDEQSSTIFFRPYRTAAIRLNQSTIEKFREATFRLQGTAKEHQWSTDWTRYEQHVQAAEQAGKQQKFRLSMQEWARAIEILFAGMPSSKPLG